MIDHGVIEEWGAKTLSKAVGAEVLGKGLTMTSAIATRDPAGDELEAGRSLHTFRTEKSDPGRAAEFPSPGSAGADVPGKQ